MFSNVFISCGIPSITFCQRRSLKVYNQHIKVSTILFDIIILNDKTFSQRADHSYKRLIKIMKKKNSKQGKQSLLYKVASGSAETPVP